MKKNQKMTRGELIVDAATQNAAQFLEANPWIAVAGAAVASHVLAAMTESTPVRRESSRAALRDWLDGAYTSLPTRKQFQSVAKSAGVPTTFEQFKARLAGDA